MSDYTDELKASHDDLWQKLRETRIENDILRALVREWSCIKCNYVYPGPPQEGVHCVICPRCGGDTMPRSMAENKELRTENERLRSALEAVEWVPSSELNASICPWCQQASQFGHASDCQRQVALHKPLEVLMLTDEQLANELTGTCPRCERTLRLHWLIQDDESIRVCVRHPKPGTKGMVECRGSNLPPAEDDVT